MKYYKITNEEECHYGMQYHDGLNVDILPFNPSGDCETGGLYFASEDILHFLDYGPWIREVTLPEGEEVYQNPVINDCPTKFKAHRIILGARRRWDDIEVFKGLVKEGATLKNFDSRCRDIIQILSVTNNVEILKFVLEDGRCDPSNYTIQMASYEGYIEIIKLLMADPRVDPTDDHCCAIRWAINSHKWVENSYEKGCIEELLKDNRFKTKENREILSEICTKAKVNKNGTLRLEAIKVIEDVLNKCKDL